LVDAGWDDAKVVQPDGCGQFAGCMMGGDVTVASEPGKGPVFTVRLPGGAEH
jgi:hypothetical protein